MPEELNVLPEAEQAAPPADPVKIFCNYPLKPVPQVVRDSANKLVLEFGKDKSWFDLVLIRPGGVTKVWVTKVAAGEVKRTVFGEVHVLKDWDPPAVVRAIRNELRKLVEGK